MCPRCSGEHRNVVFAENMMQLSKNERIKQRIREKKNKIVEEWDGSGLGWWVESDI
jgi:hypothetical protein